MEFRSVSYRNYISIPANKFAQSKESKAHKYKLSFKL